MSSDKEKEIKSEVMGRKPDCSRLVEASHTSHGTKQKKEKKKCFWYIIEFCYVKQQVELLPRDRVPASNFTCSQSRYESAGRGTIAALKGRLLHSTPQLDSRVTAWLILIGLHDSEYFPVNGELPHFL